MADASSAQDKTLPASDRKIAKAREDGQVARSRDLVHLGVLGAGVALLALLAPAISAAVGQLLSSGLRFDAAFLVEPAAMVERLGALGTQMLLLLAPLFALLIGVTLASSLASGGWNFTLKPLMPAFHKIDPIGGIGRDRKSTRLNSSHSTLSRMPSSA